MARLSGSGFAGKKTKIGFMIRDTSLEALNRFKEGNGDIVRSSGEAIDYCSDLFLSVDGSVAATACNLLQEGVAEMKLDCSDPSLSPFERQEVLVRIQKLEKMAAHFRRLANPGELLENRVPVRRVDLEGGDYVLLPDDGSWAVLDEGAASLSSHVGAVDVRGQADTDIPLIMFFPGKAVGEMNETECGEVIEKAAVSYPEIKALHSGEVEAEYDSEGRMINAVEWRACPRVGIFEVLDSTFYKSRDEAPGKALVYRVNK